MDRYATSPFQPLLCSQTVGFEMARRLWLPAFSDGQRQWVGLRAPQSVLRPGTKWKGEGEETGATSHMDQAKREAGEK